MRHWSVALEECWLANRVTWQASILLLLQLCLLLLLQATLLKHGLLLSCLQKSCLGRVHYVEMVSPCVHTKPKEIIIMLKIGNAEID